MQFSNRNLTHLIIRVALHVMILTSIVCWLISQSCPIAASVPRTGIGLFHAESDRSCWHLDWRAHDVTGAASPQVVVGKYPANPIPITAPKPYHVMLDDRYLNVSYYSDRGPKPFRNRRGLFLKFHHMIPLVVFTSVYLCVFWPQKKPSFLLASLLKSKTET